MFWRMDLCTICSNRQVTEFFPGRANNCQKVGYASNKGSKKSIPPAPTGEGKSHLLHPWYSSAQKILLLYLNSQFLNWATKLKFVQWGVTTRRWVCTPSILSPVSPEVSTRFLGDGRIDTRRVALDGGVLLTYREHSLTRSHHDDVEPTAAISRIGSLSRAAGERTLQRSGQAGSKGRALMFLASKQNLNNVSEGLEWPSTHQCTIQKIPFWDFSDGMKPNPTPGQGSGFMVFLSLSLPFSHS